MRTTAVITQLDALPEQACPCGVTRRAFGDVSGAPASVHRVEIGAEARTHFHRHMTEIYVILEGSGAMELDGERHAVRPMTAILIPPGCRHRALGRMTLLNLVIPAFDPADEWFDDEPAASNAERVG